MSRDYVIRHPQLHEAEGLAHVHIKAWEQTYQGVLPDQFWNEDAYRRRLHSWRQMLADQAHRARTRVTEVDGTVVGMAQIGPPREDDVDVEHELYMMYLLAEHQGCGASSDMLEELLHRKSASLWVLKTNSRALTFYRKHGFEPDGTEKDLGEDEGAAALAGIVEIRMVRGPQ